MYNDLFDNPQDAQAFYQSVTAPQTTKKTKGRGGTLTSLISELGGAGGAAGGAAIGTALLPGIGTLLGAGLGGFLGGTGGRVAENKVRDDRIGIGDALKEGALSGVLGGAGEAFGLAKAGKALTGEKGLANLGLNIAAGGEAKAAGKTAGLITKLGDKVQSGGLGALEPKAGIGAFGDEATRLATAKKYNISSGLKGLNQAEKQVATLEGKIQPLLSKTKVPVQSVLDAIDNAAASTLSPVAESPALVENIKNLVARQAEGDIIGADALRQIRSSLGTVFKKNTTAPIAGLQKDFYHALGETIGEFAPKAKSFIGEQGTLFDLAEGLSKKGAGARLPIPGFLGGKSQAVGVVRDLGTDAGANVLGKAGTLADSAIGSQLIKQAPGNLFDAGVSAQQDQKASLDDALMQLSNGGQQDYGLGGDMQQPEQQGGISQENLMAAIQADIQQTGGKNIGTIQQLYEMFNPSPPELNSTQASTITDLQNGLANINSLSEEFSSNGSNMPILGGLLAKNPFNTGAQTLQADVARVKQVIGKALEGGVLRKEDEVKYQKILPTLNDTDAVAQSKLQAIATDLTRKLSLYQQNVGSGTSASLEDALMSQGSY